MPLAINGFKVCSSPDCTNQNPQPLESFSNCRSNPDNKVNYCKDCDRIKSKDFRQRIRIKKPIIDRLLVIEHRRAGKKAHQAVYYAVKTGKIPPVSSLPCTNCSNIAQDYHHYLGYAKEHYFDIIPLCKMCHQRIKGV